MKSLKSRMIFPWRRTGRMTVLLSAFMLFGFVTAVVGQERHQRHAKPEPPKPGVRATVSSIGDEMRVERGGVESNASIGMKLRDGDKITVKGKGKLNWSGGGAITFEKSVARIVIGDELGGTAQKPDSTPRVGLLEGLVHFRFPRTATNKKKFEASTGTVKVTVKGTTFSIWHDGETKLSRVWVGEGTVFVAPINIQSSPFTLVAGQQVEITPTEVGRITAVAKRQPASTGQSDPPPAGEKGPSSLSGNWTMSDGTPVYLRQNGTRVTGSYQSGHSGFTGRISGTFNGKYFRGTYQNSEGGVSDAGTFQLSVTADGKLEGRWFSTATQGREGSWTLIRTGK